MRTKKWLESEKTSRGERGSCQQRKQDRPSSDKAYIKLLSILPPSCPPQLNPSELDPLRHALSLPKSRPSPRHLPRKKSHRLGQTPNQRHLDEADILRGSKGQHHRSRRFEPRTRRNSSTASRRLRSALRPIRRQTLAMRRNQVLQRRRPLALLSANLDTYRLKQFSPESSGSWRMISRTTRCKSPIFTQRVYLLRGYSIYAELADQYKILDAASAVAKRHVLADHLREIIDTLEQKVSPVSRYRTADDNVDSVLGRSDCGTLRLAASAGSTCPTRRDEKMGWSQALCA